MKRDFEQFLLTWKSQKERMPLMIRGARQVGKSYVVEQFAQTHFTNSVLVNFEQKPEYAGCFKTLEPNKIVSELELISQQRVIPGQTLLFLDEIQECPAAIMALRYFKEQMPLLHVIAAGSLLEFVINDAEFRMPVGRIQFAFLKPMSFCEYLDATGFTQMRSYLKDITLTNPPSQLVHEQLLKLVREYMAIGGMPQAVKVYAEEKSLLRCQEVQSSLLNTYRRDFGKYAKHTQHKYLEMLFRRIPGLIAQVFKYSRVSQDVQSRVLGQALDKLCDAGLAIKVHATNASLLPLASTLNEKKFKLLFLDVGLAQRAYNVDLRVLLEEDILLVNQGALSEQFVGQELLASNLLAEEAQLFFWQREAKNSSAEVDYVITVGSKIIPVEVKSGSTGKLKSLQLFMQERNSTLGIRISQQPLLMTQNTLSVPFYLISELPRLASSTPQSA